MKRHYNIMYVSVYVTTTFISSKQPGEECSIRYEEKYKHVYVTIM